MNTDNETGVAPEQVAANEADDSQAAPEILEEVELDDLDESMGGEEQPEEPAGESPGRTRDPVTGRFLPKDAKAEPEGAEEAPAQPPSPPASEPQTFQYQADGALRSIPGPTTMDTDGSVQFSAEAVPWLKQELAAAYASRNSWRQQLADAEARGNAKLKAAEAREAAADVILDKLKELRDSDEDTVYEWIQDFRENLPQLLLDAERAQLQAERDSLQSERSTEEQEREVERLVPMMEQALDILTDKYMADERFAQIGLDRDAMRNRLAENVDRVFFEHPETNEIMVSNGFVESEFAYAAQLAQRYAPALSAAEQNAQAVAQTAAPPVVPAKGGTAPSGKRSVPRFKSREEMEEYMNSSAADRFVIDRLSTET